MSLKRAFLVAAMVVATTLSAASVAQADEWYLGNATLPSELEYEAPYTGELAFTVAGGAVKIGPCEVHSEVDIFNEGAAATAEVTQLEITTPCPVTSPFPIIPPGCQVEEIGSESFPWHLSVSGTSLALEGVALWVSFANCAPTLPAEVFISGTLTGTYVTLPEDGCMTFNNSGDLASESGAITTDGFMCSRGIYLK